MLATPVDLAYLEPHVSEPMALQLGTQWFCSVPGDLFGRNSSACRTGPSAGFQDTGDGGRDQGVGVEPYNGQKPGSKWIQNTNITLKLAYLAINSLDLFKLTILPTHKKFSLGKSPLPCRQRAPPEMVRRKMEMVKTQQCNQKFMFFSQNSYALWDLCDLWPLCPAFMSVLPYLRVMPIN